jgi:hypothetical protein
MKTGYLITLLFTASLILPRMSGADDNSRLEQVEILFKLTLCMANCKLGCYGQLI